MIAMATLTIRNLDDALKARLRVRAARHGRSMEEEARQLLRQSLMSGSSESALGSRIAARFADIGGIDLPAPRRSRPRRPPGF
jgi:plasmid stability protein